MAEMWQSLQQQAGWGPPPQEKTLSEELGEMTSLTLQQRLVGFVLALAMGIVFIAIAMSFVAVIALFPKKFAFFFTCGNFFCVASTSFLVGPAQQMRTMFEQHRAQAASLYLGATILTLVAALHWQSAVLSVAFAVAQVAAVLWYALSYIPFARRVIGATLHYISYIAAPLLSALGTCCTACLRLICKV